MKFNGLLLLFIFLNIFSVSLKAEEVRVRVEGVTSIAKTDDNFVCATLDWWPSDKCDYNQCPWEKAGILNLDLKNKILANAIKAFKSLRIRVGGSLQDQVLYRVGYAVKSCPKFSRKGDGLFGFSHGCLTMKKWDELNRLFNQTGAVVTFGLNALIGRKKSEDDSSLWIGDWNSQNTRDLMEYTISKGYKIDSYELGNELCGSGVSARVEAEQYGKDVIALKELVKELYPNQDTQPKVLAPGGFYDEKWFSKFLQTSGPGVVDGVTHHIYNLGSGDDSNLINKIQDPYFLDQIAQTYKDASRTVQWFGPWAGAWIGEAGGAYNSGGKHVSHTFVDGFWYLDQLGMAATFNHKVYCRQAFIGGNYGLLNTTTFIPNPDYYGALLWHRLMGKNVLRTYHAGSPYLRVYSHCSKHKRGIAMLLINMSNSTTFEVSLVNDMNLNTSPEMKLMPEKYKGGSGGDLREEYHLTPKGGNIQSDEVLLNGTPLKLKESTREIPHMNPELVDPYTPISVRPDSIVFVTLPGFKAPACSA